MKKYTLLLKHEVCDTITVRTFDDWDKMADMIKSLSPMGRPSVPNEEGEEIKPEKLRLVVLEDEEIPCRPNLLEIFVKAEFEGEF